jgi:MFS family permease
LGAQLLFAFSITHFWGIVFSLGAYFIAFNILEATLPSIISKIAPAASKGTAIGVYNTTQSLGVFVGGTAGGFLAHHYNHSAVFIFCSALMAVWLIFALSMTKPPAVKSKMYHLKKLNVAQAEILTAALSALKGVRETVVIPQEGIAILKVDMQQDWDEAVVLKLIGE